MSSPQPTLDDLTTRCLLRAEMPLNTTRYEDGEVRNYINSSLAELYDLLVTVEGIDRFLDGYEFATANGKTQYELPDNFQKEAGLDLLAPNGTWYTLSLFGHQDRLLYQSGNDFHEGRPRFKYCVREEHIEIQPVPGSAYSCKLWYIPQMPKLVSSSDKVEDALIESWLEFVEVDVAIKLLEKDEDLERASLLKQTKQLITNRIRAAAGRSLTQPEMEPDAGNTLFNLRVQARYKAGMSGKGTGMPFDLVSDREWNHEINRSYQELNDLLLKAYDSHYLLDAYEFSTAANQRDYNLPTDFYKLGGVDIIIDGEPHTLTRFNFAERNMYENSSMFTSLGVPFFHYEIMKNSLRILPAPDRAYDIKLWYSSQANNLTSDTSVVTNTIVTGWLDFVTTDAAIKILNKAALILPASALQGVQFALNNLIGQKNALMQRIDLMVQNRVWGEPRRRVNAYRLRRSIR